MIVLMLRSGRKVVDAAAAMASQVGPSMSEDSLWPRADQFMGGPDGD